MLDMWLALAVSAALIAGLGVRMTALIRRRDAELAAAREQALRDEGIMAIGTLAAGAAHDTGGCGCESAAASGGGAASARGTRTWRRDSRPIRNLRPVNLNKRKGRWSKAGTTIGRGKG